MRNAIFVGAVLVFAITFGCSGSDSRGLVIDTEADIPSGPDVAPDIVEPECDPEQDPTGCAEGAICWFERCVHVDSETLEAPASSLVASVASLSPGGDAGAVAATGHNLVRGEDGLPESREDSLGVYTWDKSAFSAYEPLDSWTLEGNLERASSLVQVVRGLDGNPIVVSGPVTLRAHVWDGATWRGSVVLDTGARQYGSEGTFAAVVDGTGGLHVAYRDVQSEQMEIATLQEDLSWSVTAIPVQLDGWGSLVVGARAGGRAVFAHIYAEEDSPSVVRWALVADQSDEGWTTSEPSLSEGLYIRGRIMGFDAAADEQGRLTLGWVSSGRRFGVAVRNADGSWNMDDSHLSDRAIWDDLNGNLRLRWWQDTAVMTWLGYSEWECDCFDLRMAMRRAGGWQEERLDMFEGMSAGGVSLDIGADGDLLLTVGGGVDVDRGLEAPMAYLMSLPDWRE